MPTPAGLKYWDFNPERTALRPPHPVAFRRPASRPCWHPPAAAQAPSSHSADGHTLSPSGVPARRSQAGRLAQSLRRLQPLTASTFQADNDVRRYRTLRDFSRSLASYEPTKTEPGEPSLVDFVVGPVFLQDLRLHFLRNSRAIASLLLRSTSGGHYV